MKQDAKNQYEFGGPIGSLGIIVFFSYACLLPLDFFNFF